MSVSHRLDAEVQIQNPDGKCRKRTVPKYLCVLRDEEMQSGRTKCANRPCAFGCEDATECECIGIDGSVEGEDSDPTFQQIPVSSEEEAVGQSLLAARIFRGFSGGKRRNNKAICKASG